MNEIELINQQLEDLEKQIQLKRQEMIKAKLRHIKENGIEEIASMTDKEIEMIKKYLLKYGNPTSTLIQHEWSEAYYPEDQGHDYDEYHIYVQLGSKLYNIESNDFTDLSRLEDDYTEGNPENMEDYRGLESVLGSKDKITEEFDIDQLFDTTKNVSIENISEDKHEKVNLSKYVYDISSHSIVDYDELYEEQFFSKDEDENEYEEDDEYDDYDYDDNQMEWYQYLPYLKETIWHILRNQIPDMNSNYMFGESNNFCQIGQYDDMPGEEEIANILNSIDRTYLKEYFKSSPDDLKLFEQIREKYGDVLSLDEETIINSKKEQFEESLIREDVVEYYLSKSREEIEEDLGEEVAKMVGFEQKNSHHCYDLWEHTLRTVEGIRPEGLTPDQFKKLRVAAFFHDIGKPDVSKFNEQTGQQVFYGHAMHSVEVARPILAELGYNKDEIEQLGFYIGHHDDFISYKSKLAPFMKNHEFIRDINPATVTEKIIENRFDFEGMGYNKDQIRAICYTLAHNQKPDFRIKNQPIVIDVDMNEVRSKINSGNYTVNYDASLEDYQMLLQLCKADASAQSEIAMQKGKVVGSKAEKLENMTNIEQSVPEAYKKAMIQTDKDEFASSIVNYATKKVELREKDVKAKKLAQEYEQQMPNSQHSMDDE